MSQKLVERIDGAPVLSERIKTYLSEDTVDLFFFNQKYLMQYQSASSEVSKEKVPGSSYFAKVERFITTHYKIGELFMEILKGRCKSVGPCCKFCDNWNGPPMESVPQPVPDLNNPGRYKSLFDTIRDGDDGERKADDWQPRANITKLFNCKQLSLNDQDKVTDFASNFCVKKEYVVVHLQHLTNLALVKEIRSKQREKQRIQKKNKTYEEYESLEMALNGKLSGLTIPELDKYLDKNNLMKREKKIDKIRAIVADVLQKSPDEEIERARQEASEDDENDAEDAEV